MAHKQEELVRMLEPEQQPKTIKKTGNTQITAGVSNSGLNFAISKLSDLSYLYRI